MSGGKKTMTVYYESNHGRVVLGPDGRLAQMRQDAYADPSELATLTSTVQVLNTRLGQAERAWEQAMKDGKRLHRELASAESALSRARGATSEQVRARQQVDAATAAMRAELSRTVEERTGDIASAERLIADAEDEIARIERMAAPKNNEEEKQRAHLVLRSNQFLRRYQVQRADAIRARDQAAAALASYDVEA